MQQRTTIWPAISSSVTSADQHGSGSSNQKVEVFDQYGQLTWVMDESGFLTRFKYDNASGALIQRIDDVSVGMISDSPAVPATWSTPSGGGLHLVTDFTVDNLGRITQALGPQHAVAISGTSTQIRRATWTVYKQTGYDAPTPFNEVRWAQGYQTVATSSSSSSNSLIEPITVTQQDRNGRDTKWIQSLRDSGVTGALTSGEDLAMQARWTRWKQWWYYNCSLQANMLRVYKIINPKSPDPQVYADTLYGFDTGSSAMGLLIRQQAPGGTITRLVYDAVSRVASRWVGTDDTGATDSSPGGTSPNNMTQVESYQYDGGSAGGDGNLTAITKYVDASGTADRITYYTYDYRNRRATASGPSNFYEIYSYDNQDRLTQVDGKNGSGGLLISRTISNYDNLGRIYQRLKYAVDITSGNPGNALTDGYWYDARGNLMKSITGGSMQLTKFTYDGAGRRTVIYHTVNSSDTSYTTASTISGDTVLHQEATVYDAADNVIQVTKRRRFHNASGTGALDGTSTEPRSRISYVAYWPDGLGREQASANYGTNASASFSRPATIPGSSATVLVNKTSYTNRGEVFQTTDPKGIVTEYTFDDGARKITVIADKGTSTINQRVDYTYTLDDLVLTQAVQNSATGSGVQTTSYCYGTTLTDSDVASNEILRATIFPDSSDSCGSGSDQVLLAYNRQGQIKLKTDQAGTVHSLLYDALGRLTDDCVTSFGTGIDQAVKRVTRTYEVRGLIDTLTSYNNATPGSGTALNQISYTYNTFSQLITETQEHGGTTTGSSPKVQYAYDGGSANEVRLNAFTYPNGNINSFNYGTSGQTDDLLSRVTAILRGTTHLADYLYLGISDFVQANYSSEPGVALTYIMQTGDSTGDAGDQYLGLDRFDRVVDQRWIVTSTLAAKARIQYGFDQNNNRTFRNDLVAGTGQDEFYTYDNLNQLKSLQRGTLNGTRTAITGTPSWEEDFSFDTTGNWHGASGGYIRKDNTGSTVLNQSRSNNSANEITGITTTTGTGWSVPSYDAAGNMTSMPQPMTVASAYVAAYDAWNRLISIKSGASTVASFAYDGANRRVTKTIGSNVRHYYYSNKWQILEERLNTSTSADRQFTWGQRYDDDLIMRDCSTFTPNRFYCLHDYFNPVAVIDTSANVDERYGYNAYGFCNFMTGSYGGRSGSSYDWETLFGAYRFDSESTLYQVRNRIFHCMLGSWISRDPLEYDDGLNLYAYARNNSVNWVDSQGLKTEINCSELGPKNCPGMCVRDNTHMVQGHYTCQKCTDSDGSTCCGCSASWPEFPGGKPRDNGGSFTCCGKKGDSCPTKGPGTHFPGT